jgi:hypothetical protein
MYRNALALGRKIPAVTAFHANGVPMNAAVSAREKQKMSRKKT